jgi:hypothetical protein
MTIPSDPGTLMIWALGACLAMMVLVTWPGKDPYAGHHPVRRKRLDACVRVRRLPTLAALRRTALSAVRRTLRASVLWLSRL